MGQQWTGDTEPQPTSDGGTSYSMHVLIGTVFFLIGLCCGAGPERNANGETIPTLSISCNGPRK